VVIPTSLVALGAGNLPCGKLDEGNRVFFRLPWSHVLTKNYSVIAFPVSALNAIISVYGHVAHLAALEASRLSVLRCNQAAPRLSRLPPNQAEHRGQHCGFALGGGRKILGEKVSTSAKQLDVPLQSIDRTRVVHIVRERVRVSEGQQYAD
jgi:hypothetical protein